MQKTFIIEPDAPVLVTGASGFIGSALVGRLLERGHRRVRAMARPTSDLRMLSGVIDEYDGRSKVEVMRGNLLSRPDCTRAVEGIQVVFHLAAGTGDKSFPGAFMDSVVTTRNLLDACVSEGRLRRFVNVSSFAVYPNMGNPRGRILDETAPVAAHPEQRGDAYSFAKGKQDQMVEAYGRSHALPYVIVRPGAVYGPGRSRITGRVGLDTFGFFLHLGGRNRIPFTYVDNCADLIALAGLTEGVDGEVFNAVDDDLPTSGQFLRLYKRHVRSFGSVYVPHALSYMLCSLWERYSRWSQGQLPPVFSTKRWHAEWKRTRYPNEKAKNVLGWSPSVSMKDGLARYFESCRRISAGA